MSNADAKNNRKSNGEGAGPTRSFDSSALGPGGQIGSFRIERELGRGAVGVVYLAHDTKLDRPVAIKSLPTEVMKNPKARSRFSREARVLASLNHPNIATIYDEFQETKDVAYLILEYVPGQTLAERIAKSQLKLEETLSIALQIAEAVAAAHEHDVIHRDLKPGNIKITPQGKVKVLDFGLAKAVGGEALDQQTTITQPGRVIGTPAYMSPEQARGKPTDKRSDIWSFGCVLYEMLTAKIPFKGETVSDTLANILQTEPEWHALPQSTPANIQVLLRRCLTKDPQHRLRDIGDASIEISETMHLPATASAVRPAAPVRTLRRRPILIGLAVAVLVVLLAVVGPNIGRWLGGARPGRIESLAVLPLKNLSGDPEQEYFADGMTDALIANLGKIGALRVISRQSVMRYKGSDKPLLEIARELNVDAVVEGSVLRVGEQVRITAQLIEGATDRHLWVESYERDLRDILALQSEVAQAIAREIKVAVTPTEEARLTSTRPVNPEAQDFYLKGWYHYNKLSKEGFDRASECFREAIKVDPSHARAYVGLANCYGLCGFFGYIPPKEGCSKGMELAKKALEIDESLAEAHESLAAFKFYCYWDWAGAEEGFKRAHALNPNLVGANEYAWLLMAVGRFDEAIAEAERTLRLDPFTVVTNSTLAHFYTHARQYDQALAQWQRFLELGLDDARAYSGFARVYELMGKFEDCVRFQQKAMTLRGDPPEDIEALGLAYSESGPKGYWMWYLDRLKGRYDRNPTNTAIYYAQLGDKDQAFAWLEKAYEKHDMELFRLKYNQRFDPLRDEPRFGDLLRRMNFPE